MANKSSSCISRYFILILLFPILAFCQNEKPKDFDLNKNLLDEYQQIDKMLQTSAELINRNLDSAVYYAEMANRLIENIESDSAKSKIFKSLGDVYVARGNFALSLDYYFKSKNLIDNLKNQNPNNLELNIEQASLLNRIGIVQFSFKKNEQALLFYEEALKLLENIKILSPDYDISSQKKILLNNIAGVYIHRNEYDKALENYKIVAEISDKDINETFVATLSNNMGICYLEKGDLGLADYYFQKSLSIRKKLGDKRGEAQCYNNIGKIFVYQKKYNEAKKYFSTALNLGKEIGNMESILVSLESLSSVYSMLGEYKNAFETYKELKQVNDSLFNLDNNDRIAQLEMQYKLNKQQELFDSEIENREREKAYRDLSYLIVGGSLFFLLLTSTLLIFLQRSKIKNSRLENEKLELEHKNIRFEKQKLEEDLEFKNRELATNVLYLLKKNELISNISEKLIKSKLDFKHENQKIIQEIIHELKRNQDSTIWAEFEAHFTQVHTDFYRRLNDKFPNLSSNEKKLCAFLRLNMSTKDISAITYQSVNSITVARSRLRKKLQIEGEEMNMVHFLMQL